MLNNIVENIEQCGQHNIVQGCLHQHCNKLFTFCFIEPCWGKCVTRCCFPNKMKQFFFPPWYINWTINFSCFYSFALQQGRSTKRLPIYLPGGITKVLKVQTCSVSLVVIHDCRIHVTANIMCVYHTCPPSYNVISYMYFAVENYKASIDCLERQRKMARNLKS